MSARKRRMIEKANALFSHNKEYTFRELMVSYRYWKNYIRMHKDYIWCRREFGRKIEYNYEK